MIILLFDSVDVLRCSGKQGSNNNVAHWNENANAALKFDASVMAFRDANTTFLKDAFGGLFFGGEKSFGCNFAGAKAASKSFLRQAIKSNSYEQLTNRLPVRPLVRAKAHKFHRQ